MRKSFRYSSNILCTNLGSDFQISELTVKGRTQLIEVYHSLSAPNSLIDRYGIIIDEVGWESVYFSDKYIEMKKFLHQLRFHFWLILLGLSLITVMVQGQSSIMKTFDVYNQSERSSQNWKTNPWDYFHIRNDHSRLNNLNHPERGSEEINFYPDTVIVYSLENDPQRYSYFYSTDGERLVTFVKEFKNSTWVNAAMENCTYDIYGNRLTSVWQIWQSTLWVNGVKTINTYGTNNVLLTQTMQVWSGSQWVNDIRITNTYDASGNKVAALREKWLSGVWESEYYELLVYDGSNNLLNITGQFWNAVYWLNDQYLEFTYTTDNKLLSGEFRSWVNDEWLNIYREDFTYNSNGLLSQYLGKTWLGSGWLFSEKNTYTYNINGYVEYATNQSWQVNQWVNSKRTFFTSNTFGGIVTSLEEIWNSGQWVNDALFNCVYDEYSNASNCEFYKWNGTTWEQSQDAVLELNYSNGVETVFLTGYKATASYISLLVGINSFTNNTLELYPNPASQVLYVRNSVTIEKDTNIELYSLDGKLVYSIIPIPLQNDSFSIRIELPELSKGMYIIKFISGNQLKSEKIIIQ